MQEKFCALTYNKALISFLNPHAKLIVWRVARKVKFRMRKINFLFVFIFILVTAFVFTACNTSEDAYADAEDTQTAEEEADVEETESEETTASEEEAAADDAELTAPDPSFTNTVGTCRVKTDPAFAYPAVTEADWSIGPADAEVTIIIYSDLQCPYCAMMDPSINELYQAHADETRMVFRHFPLDYHANAKAAAIASEVVGEALGAEAFFEFISTIFATQAEWQELSAEDFTAYLVALVESSYGLDGDEFTARMGDAEIAELVDADYTGGQAFVSGTPFVMINGIPLMYFPKTITSFEDAYAFAKNYPNLVYKECPEMTVDMEKQYLVTVITTKGSFVMELYPKSAPYTVNSFLFLAKDGYYNNSPFHRVIDGFVAQAGTGITGELGTGYEFDNEIDRNLKYDKAGVVGMANAGENTNGSQFFITYAPQPTLDGSYTIFGQVIEGMDVVESLTKVNPQTDETAIAPDTIISVVVTVK